MSIEDSIRQLASRLGAGPVGFADVSCLPIEITDGLTRAVSLAVALDPAVIRDIRDGPTTAYLVEYERANVLLDHLSGQVTDVLRDAGHHAHVFRATTEQIDKTTLATRFQHKTAATRGAGVDRQMRITCHERVRIRRSTRLRPHGRAAGDRNANGGFALRRLSPVCRSLPGRSCHGRELATRHRERPDL